MSPTFKHITKHSNMLLNHLSTVTTAKVTMCPKQNMAIKEHGEVFARNGVQGDLPLLCNASLIREQARLAFCRVIAKFGLFVIFPEMYL